MTERRLAWFTMDGRVGDTIAPPQNWIEGVVLSPDGKRVVASAADGLWASTWTRAQPGDGRALGHHPQSVGDLA